MVHQENTPAMQPAPGKGRRGSGECRLRKLHGEPERAALSGMAFNPDPAMHLADEALANSEPQSGATESSGGGAVGLYEGVKQSSLRRFWNTNPGIFDGEAQKAHAVLSLTRHVEEHFACGGKLDGIADQIHQDLPETAGIAYDGGRHGGID